MAFNSPIAIEEPVAFTPHVTFGGNSNGLTYATRNCFWRKIIYQSGVIEVQIWGYVGFSNKGSSTGVSVLEALPWTFGTNGSLYTISLFTGNITYTANSIPALVGIASTDTAGLVCFVNGGGSTQMDDTGFTNNSNFAFNGSYLTN